MSDESWIDGRMRTLDPPDGWTPNAHAALARLHRSDRVRRSWIWVIAVASVACLVLVALPARATCALAGVGCPRSKAIQTVAALDIAPAPAIPHVTAPSPAKPVAAKRPSPEPAWPAATAVNFRESGSPDAPIACEIYSDYECPSCGEFYRTVFPLLVSEYVRAGKVRILHRDFPLPQHPYARLATRYANAAGRLGFYDQVVAQLFLKQGEWSATGNVDEAVAAVVPRPEMDRIRGLVQSDRTLDATVVADIQMASQDRINATPTIVVVSKGQRRKLVGVQSFDILRSYLDELLAQ